MLFNGWFILISFIRLDNLVKIEIRNSFSDLTSWKTVRGWLSCAQVVYKKWCNNYTIKKKYHTYGISVKGFFSLVIFFTSSNSQLKKFSYSIQLVVLWNLKASKFIEEEDIIYVPKRTKKEHWRISYIYLKNCKVTGIIPYIHKSNRIDFRNYWIVVRSVASFTFKKNEFAPKNVLICKNFRNMNAFWLGVKTKQFNRLWYECLDF